MFNVAKGLFCNLQRPSIEDYDTLVSWLNDPFLKDSFFGISSEDAAAEEMAKFWIEENTILFGSENLVLIAKHAKTDQAIGLLLFKNIDWKNKTIDMHYMIANQEKRDGPYGPEMVLTALVYLFHTLNFRKVHGYVYNNNNSSMSIASFAGREEGILKNYTYHDGQWLDYHLYALNQNEFQCFLNKHKTKMLRHHFKKGFISK